MPKTCFVISPIGDEDSTQRQEADDFLELIVEPSLEGRGYKVIRADKIVSSGVITNEIVELVQGADLCIVDLTGHNANVFYECGRRHEAARPFIQMIRKGDKLPFDVAGIRTIPYDLSDPRSVRNTISDLRSLVDALSSTSTTVSRSAVSLTTVAEAIDRLERKIDKLQGEHTFLPETKSALAKSRKYPLPQLYMMAVAREDWQEAAGVIAEMHEQKGLIDEVLIGALRVAAEGWEVGRNILFEALDNLPDSPTDSTISHAEAVRSLLWYYKNVSPSEGLARLKERAELVIANEVVDIEMRASISNAVQMLAYAEKDYEVALEFGEKACELNSQEAIFRKNLSMTYEKTEQLGKAKEAIDLAMASPGGVESATVVEQAVDVYHALGEHDAVDRYLGILAKLDPDLAQFKVYMYGLDSKGQSSTD